MQQMSNIKIAFPDVWTSLNDWLTARKKNFWITTSQTKEGNITVIAVKESSTTTCEIGLIMSQ